MAPRALDVGAKSDPIGHGYSDFACNAFVNVHICERCKHGRREERAALINNGDCNSRL